MMYIVFARQDDKYSNFHNSWMISRHGNVIPARENFRRDNNNLYKYNQPNLT